MLLRVLDTSTRPRAKNPVNTSPITVSSLTRDFCFTNPIAATDPTPKTKAPRKGQAQGVGHHHAGQHRMGDGIPHQRPTLEGHVAGEQSADASHQGAHQQRSHHEGVTEGFQQPVHAVRDSGALILIHQTDS